MNMLEKEEDEKEVERNQQRERQTDRQTQRQRENASCTRDILYGLTIFSSMVEHVASLEIDSATWAPRQSCFTLD